MISFFLFRSFGVWQAAAAGQHSTASLNTGHINRWSCYDQPTAFDLVHDDWSTGVLNGGCSLLFLGMVMDMERFPEHGDAA